MFRPTLAAIIALFFLTAPAHAAQVCAWLVESNAPGNTRNLDLWFEAAAPYEFRYEVGGRGITMNTGDSNRPDSSSLSLSAGQQMKAWSYATTFYPPGRIDITVEIHRIPLAGAMKAVTPVLAKFKFAREIPADEKDPPQTLAKKQCLEIVDGN